MSDYDAYLDLTDEARSLGFTIERAELRKRALAIAETMDLPDILFEALTNYAHDALKASMFEESFFAFVRFAKMYDDDPERFNRYENFVLYFHSWAIGHVCFYASVSKDQIETTLASYRRRLEEHGVSLGQYWMSVVEVGQHLGFDEERVREAYYESVDVRSTLPNRCGGCLVNFDTRYHTYRNEYDQAVEKGLAAIDGNTVCDSAPHVTYSYLVLPAFLNGDERAGLWSRAGYDLVRDDRGHISTICRHLNYAVAADNLDYALEIFERSAGWGIETRDDYDRLSFCTPAQALLQKLSVESPTRELRLPKGWSQWNGEGVYELATLVDVLSAENRETAERFDARNQNTYVSDQLKETLSNLGV